YRCSQCQETLFGAESSETSPSRKVPKKKRQRPPLMITLLNLAYLFLLLVLTLSNAAGPEGWWLGSFNLYLPQWLWALPTVLILPLTFGFARKWVWVPLLALLWVLGPIMGFCWHWGLPVLPEAVPARVPGVRLRVMTYNVKGGRHDGAAIVRDIRTFHPDLIQFQDSEDVLKGPVGQALAGWNIRVSGQYVVASLSPISELEPRDISYVGGSPHHCVRYLLQLGKTPVAVYNVHLLSPRLGLVSVRHRQIGGIVGNTESRLQEAARLAGYVQAETGPTVVTGDLNAPVQAIVCRGLFAAGLRDAFSESGYGYGYSYGAFTPIGHSYVRIDHILASRQWQFSNCWVGNEIGSEHCPVIADLVLP
ncbi:MAG: endonuclease/exonuclease/phosphatase family protein, partial [Ktedonobacteraceae bacterium]|nr:endonuclease/exonuclease/phosphatase family protein [Ktedonobacteraceae bacterium]